jgi:hypothetical protein
VVLGSGPAVQGIVLGPGDRLFDEAKVKVKQLLGLRAGDDRGFAIDRRHGAMQIVKIHTNTIEGYYSIFKRGMKGVYQHCAEKHLHRYLAEFDFRYSNRVRLGVDDVQRTERAVKGITGKRLMYRSSGH